MSNTKIYKWFYLDKKSRQIKFLSTFNPVHTELHFIYMSLTIPNLVPQRPFCYLNFISVAKSQKFGNETYDAHVLASSKTYRKQNKPKKWIPNR